MRPGASVPDTSDTCPCSPRIVACKKRDLACRLVRNIKRACIAGARRRRSTHRRVVARVSSHARELHPRVVCSAVYILSERASLRAETRASNVLFALSSGCSCRTLDAKLQSGRYFARAERRYSVRASAPRGGTSVERAFFHATTVLFALLTGAWCLHSTTD